MDVPQQLHMYGIMRIQIPSMTLLERAINVNCTKCKLHKLQAINMAIEYVIIPYIFATQKFINFDSIQTVSNNILYTQPLYVYRIVQL